MPDATDLLIATGIRIGELLALRWVDIDLEATPPTLTVSGTLVEVKGRPLSRQDFPKTDGSNRVLSLPAFAVSVLRRRRSEAGEAEDTAPVFPSKTGGWFYPANFARLWRSIREEYGLGTITPHTFRRTVATLIESETDTRTASEVLGHADEKVTREHYLVPRIFLAPDVSRLLEKHFGPAAEKKPKVSNHTPRHQRFI